MATGQTVIDRATALLGVREPGTTYSSEDSDLNAMAFIALQNLIAEWAEDDTIQIPAPALVSDTLDVPPGSERALAYNLAVDFAPEVRKPVPEILFAIAKKTRDRLRSQSTIDLSVDLSDLSFSWKYNVESDR